MGNTISISLSILQVGGYILLLNWACSLHLPADKTIVSLMSELRQVFHITGGFIMSLCIPFSLNMVFMLHSHSLSIEKIGFGFSILGLSFYNLSCYRLSYHGVSHDALLLSGVIGLSGARIVIHHGYKLWTQDTMEFLQVHSNSRTILTEPDSESHGQLFKNQIVGRALAYFLRSLYLGLANLLPYLSIIYSSSSTAATPFPGLILVIAGISLAAISDWQRERQEDLDPESFCSAGLFRFSRYPDSGGQILYHIGILSTCFSHTPITPIVFLSGLPHFISIIGILFNVRRKDSFLKLTQITNSRYMQYRASTNLIIPKIF